MTDGTIVKTIYLKAPRARVWAYLTEADKLARWFHEADKTLEAGQDYALMSENTPGEKTLWGKVVESDAPSRLVYTFTHDHLAGVETLVTWELVETDGGTQLTMTHSGFEKAGDNAFAMLAAHDKGWDEHFARLRMVAS